MPVRQDLQIRQGETWGFAFAHTDEAGAVVDLSEYSARMMLRRSFCREVEATLSSGADSLGGLITLHTDGRVEISMTAKQTFALIEDEARDLIILDPERIAAFKHQSLMTNQHRFQNFIYDLELTAPDGAVTRALQGMVSVEREVTR